MDRRQPRGWWRSVAGVLLLSLGAAPDLQAETISQSLMRAYKNNPDVNQQRAGVRAADENIGRAAAAWRPTINGAATAGLQYNDVRFTGQRFRQLDKPVTAGIQAQQNLFNGLRTLNSVRQAESQVLNARETARLTEQNVLLNAAASHMNVLRDLAILSLRRNNIAILEEQLRQTREQFRLSQVTRTDVAQADNSLAQGRRDFSVAQVALQASMAGYRQVVGIEPRRLEPARALEQLLPRRLTDAVEQSQVEHPAIVAALHQVDVAELAVRIAEGALFPTLSVAGAVNQTMTVNVRTFSASLTGQLNVPIYQGGGDYAAIRQAKEQASQARLQADVQRDLVRAALVVAWAELEGSRTQIVAGQSAVTTAEVALAGIREEARIGQRTTHDILVAQQTLVDSRVLLVAAQRDRVVASYSVLAAMGRLNPGVLGLPLNEYDPTIHFDQVKDKLIGLRTSDGK